MTDGKIAVGLKKQDTEALVCLMERYSNYISSIIGQLLKNYGTVQDTEELMADVFLTIWNTADKLNMDAYSSLKGYIGTIARNKAKDFLRKKRFVTLALDDDILLLSENIEKEFLQREQQEIIRKALNQLSIPTKDIFIRYYYRYEKISDIALALDMNVQTVKSHLSRGRKFLKKVLVEEYHMNRR